MFYDTVKVSDYVVSNRMIDTRCLEIIWKHAVVTFRYYGGICLKDLRVTKKKLTEHRQYLNEDSNHELPEE
jgi:hypothetical protein